MSLAILLAAWISFGQLSFDLSAVAAAQDRLMDTLKDRNLRAVRNELNQTDAQGHATAIDPDEQINIHAVTNAGHYYETKFSSGNTWISSFTRDRSFQAKREQAAWSLSALLKPESEKHRFRTFLLNSYSGLFFFDGNTLSERLHVPGFRAASLPLDRTRRLIWGFSPGRMPLVFAAVSFHAIIRFSDSGQLAFNEMSESLVMNSFVAMRVVTTTNARFVSDAFDCPGIELKATHYPNCKTEEEVRNCKTAVTVRSRIDLGSDVDVKDEQLTPAYYGISDTTIRNHIHQADTEAKAIARLRPPTPHTPRSNSNSEHLDLAIAIGIPVVLLGVLLIVIRKT